MFVCVPEHMAEQAVACMPTYRHVEGGEEPSFSHLLEVIYETAAGPHLQDPHW